MGLIDGLKKQYMLYQIDGWKMCSVTPLEEDTFKLGNYADIHFRNTFSGTVTKDELEKLKRKHKLFRKEELQQQMTINELLF
ncbi:hypothetical protein K4U50_06380 [Staphylococcus epidermidis]|nr:hypothetical protein [Staphylococcus epidermidis]